VTTPGCVVLDRGVATVSDRLLNRVRADFEPNAVTEVLEQLARIPESLPLGDTQDPERMQAALVIPARGNLKAFLGLVSLANRDWRDALVGAGLGYGDWPERLDELLGRE